MPAPDPATPRSDDAPARRGLWRGLLARLTWTGWVKLASLAVAAAGLAVIVRVLPVGRIVESAAAWIDALGPWAPVGMVAAYTLATLMLLPASLLTLLAGAIFGLWWGTVLISIGEVLSAAAAFLLARYAARDAVKKRIRAYPSFAAIDAAIAEGGATLVALVRLSLFVPFGVGNYVLGLTGVRFWPYLLATWLAMLPGTFLFAYVGHLGRRSLAAPAGGEGGRGAGEWALLVLGLAATIAVSVFITRRATRALRERARLDRRRGERDGPEPPPTPQPLGALAAACCALAVAGIAAWAHVRRDALVELFPSAPEERAPANGAGDADTPPDGPQRPGDER